MSSRRFHKKSRTGCMPCRSRRIKCDETHPNCANCQRADLSCHYPRRTPAPASPQINHSEQDASSASSQIESEERTGFDLLDLRLMHHFTLVTSASLFEDSQQRLWQEEIPLQASSCPLLMHGILAIAALHLALSKSAESSSLLDRALHHHTLSLQLFNRQITASNSSNAHLHFSFTVLLTVWAYGSVAPMDDQYLQLDGLLDSLELVRLGKSMFELHSDDIRREAIGQFTGFDASRAKKYVSDTVRQALTGLRAKADDFIDTMAIDHMEHHLQFSKTTGDVRFVIGCPAVVENAFWARIRSHKPVAMLILAHYSMLLAKCKEHHWWISGWADRVLLVVENILPDSEKRRLDWETHGGWIRHEMMSSP